MATISEASCKSHEYCPPTCPDVDFQCAEAVRSAIALLHGILEEHIDGDVPSGLEDALENLIQDSVDEACDGMKVYGTETMRAAMISMAYDMMEEYETCLKENIELKNLVDVLRSQIPPSQTKELEWGEPEPLQEAA